MAKKSAKKSPYIFHGQTFTVVINPKLFIEKNVPAVKISNLPAEVTDKARSYLKSTHFYNTIVTQLNSALESQADIQIVVDYIHIGYSSLKVTVHGHVEVRVEANIDNYPKGYVKELMVDCLSRKQQVHKFSDNETEYTFCFNNPKQPSWEYD